ncbi:MAG: hypothetical protein Q4D51_12905 [Eubacteriales bacterium]|nr:hypothetical protein [Eubacteriales bacterium]
MIKGKKAITFVSMVSILVAGIPAITKAADMPNLNAPVTYENVMTVLKQYNPDGAVVVEADGEHALWVWGDEERISKEIGTCVHESCHDYTSRNSVPQKTKVVRVPGGKQYDVPMTDYFLTTQMDAEIPAILKDRVYEIYLSSDPSSDSVRSGIYGLLNEFAAYEMGFHTQVELYAYYSSQSYELEAWKDYIGGCISDRNTFLKFKYYILLYLDYAKSYEPEIYQQLLANDTLLEAIRDIDSQYQKDAQQFMESIPKTIQILQSQGEYYARDTWPTWNYSRNGGIGKQSQSYWNIIEQLSTSNIAAMEKVIGTKTVSVVAVNPAKERKVPYRESVTFQYSSTDGAVTTKNEDDGVVISWGSYGDCTDGIWIERKNDKAGGYELLADLPKTTKCYKDTTAVKGETYWYRVVPYGYYESPAVGQDSCSVGWQDYLLNHPVKIQYTESTTKPDDEKVPDAEKTEKKKQSIQVAEKAKKTIVYKASSLKKKQVSFQLKAKAKGKITYKVTKGSKKVLVVSKSGKVTLKKGCPKGTYQITITAAATKQYKKAVKKVTIRVKG